MKRRDFIANASFSGLGLVMLPMAQGFGDFFQGNDFYYLSPVSLRSPSVAFPAGKRVPYGWHTFAVPAAGSPGRVSIRFGKAGTPFGSMRLRVCIALDIREEIMINVYLGASQVLLGSFDIRYPHILQPFELLIDPSHHEMVLKKGVSLKMVKGTVPAWFFSHKGDAGVDNEALRLHLLLSSSTGGYQQFLRQLASLNSVQQFGWMEGCVLDGLFDLFRQTNDDIWLSTLNRHLGLFFDKEKKLDYEDPRSNMVYNRIYGIEGPLPIAVIAKLEPQHPVLGVLRDFCREHQGADGLIGEGNITTEGCYTLAYPMAETAVALHDPELAEMAIKQLLLRHKYLFVDGNIHQRGTRDQPQGFANWARGVAWYMLGFARTIISLGKMPGFENLTGFSEVMKRYEESVIWALKYQQANGLWYCFLKEALTGYDTSGSAGIAAAMALGEKHGFLSFSVREQAGLTKNELMKHLTPDGFLTGAAQSNKGGEALQRSGYRVISQYPMGLLAQLVAALQG